MGEEGRSAKALEPAGGLVEVGAPYDWVKWWEFATIYIYDLKPFKNQYIVIWKSYVYIYEYK